MVHHEITEAGARIIEDGGAEWRALPREVQAEFLITYAWQNGPPLSEPMHDLIYEAIVATDDDTVEAARAGCVAAKREGRSPLEFFKDSNALRRRGEMH